MKDNVVTKKDGFKYIDNIPMVDQGPKGYCAAATTTRILQYYGSNMDMHQVGALIKVTSGGTNPAVMLKQLKKATPELGTIVYSYMDPPEFTGNISCFSGNRNNIFIKSNPNVCSSDNLIQDSCDPSTGGISHKFN